FGTESAQKILLLVKGRYPVNVLQGTFKRQRHRRRAIFGISRILFIIVYHNFSISRILLSMVRCVKPVTMCKRVPFLKSPFQAFSDEFTNALPTLPGVGLHAVHKRFVRLE